MKRVLALAILLGSSTPALAQRTEVAVLGGYTTPGDIEMKAVGIQEQEVKGSFTWGLQAGRFFTDQVGFEVTWSRQETALALGTAAGRADLFEMNASLLHGSVVYRFGSDQARVAPFVTAGAGATFFSADDLDGETKFSWAIGAGITWFPSQRAGAKVQARYAPTMLNDTSSDFCDPFGFCQGSLKQFELMGGLVLRF